MNIESNLNILRIMIKSSSDQSAIKKSNTILSGELAVKITQGDSSASNEFVEINYRWLLFIIRKKFYRSNNHEDIVQDTFMLVISNLQQGKVREHQAILAYLRTTAINIGYEYLRKDKKFTSAIDQELLEVIEDSQTDILSSIIWNDKVKYVKQVIDELKKQRDKDILIRFYFNDQDKPSICGELNLSSEHFDRVLYRAKQRLKQLIDKKGDHHPNNSLKSLNKNKQTSKSSMTFKMAHILLESGLQSRYFIDIGTTIVKFAVLLTRRVRLPTSVIKLTTLIKQKFNSPKTTGASA